MGQASLARRVTDAMVERGVLCTGTVLCGGWVVVGPASYSSAVTIAHPKFPELVVQRVDSVEVDLDHYATIGVMIGELHARGLDAPDPWASEDEHFGPLAGDDTDPTYGERVAAAWLDALDEYTKELQCTECPYWRSLKALDGSDDGLCSKADHIPMTHATARCTLGILHTSPDRRRKT